MAPKTILALDPSSTCTGYAVLDFSGRLIEGGILRPTSARLDPATRISQMCADLRALLNLTRPKAIVIEWTSGHVGGRRHHGHGSGLAIYGVALGSLWQTAVGWAQGLGIEVIRILENTWTRGIPKVERSARVRMLYPSYNPAADPGGDLADAVGIAVFYLELRRHGLQVDRPEISAGCDRQGDRPW